jgi:hypothetical protein
MPTHHSGSNVSERLWPDFAVGRLHGMDELLVSGQHHVALAALAAKARLLLSGFRRP